MHSCHILDDGRIIEVHEYPEVVVREEKEWTPTGGLVTRRSVEIDKDHHDQYMKRHGATKIINPTRENIRAAWEEKQRALLPTG